MIRGWVGYDINEWPKNAQKCPKNRLSHVYQYGCSQKQKELKMECLNKEIGFLEFLFDRKCFQRLKAARATRMLPRCSWKELMIFARDADDLHEGVAVELLKEIARRDVEKIQEIKNV